MTLPKRVTVFEVGPRDGLQNEKASIPVDDKVACQHSGAEFHIQVSEPGRHIHDVTEGLEYPSIRVGVDSHDSAIQPYPCRKPFAIRLAAIEPQ